MNPTGSIFRLIVGASLISRHRYDLPTWGDKKTRSAEKEGEPALEREVSTVIGGMPFLWLSIDDEAGPYSRRSHIEKHSIALLSNYNRSPLDPPSTDWLGRHCDRERVRNSGLWNSDYVDEGYDPAFLDEFERLVSATGRAS